MRMAFIKKLEELAAQDERIFLLTGDLGFSVLESFREKFSSRYLNVGVAEANMIGVSAGLALSGKIPFVYSIVPFATMRCFEQIRNDLCHQNLSVKIVGIGGGLTYGAAGTTHHSIEDIAIMRSLPNMTVICPGDPLEAALSVSASVRYSGPVYIRIGKKGEPVIHKDTPKFEIGKAIQLEDGDDLTIISTGNMLETCSNVSQTLKEKGISVRLLSMHTVKPLDENAVLTAARETKAIFSVEEHSIIGGLGSAVAEVLAEKSEKNVKFKRIGIPDTYAKVVGDQEYLRSMFSLSPEQIVKTILSEISH